MKKLIACLLIFCLLMPCAVLADGLKFTDIEHGKEYIIRLEKKLYLDPKGPAALYYIAQGCATDGEHGYFVTHNKANNQDAVWRVNLSDWTVEQMEYALPLGHGNDATVNTKTNKLYVVNLDDPNSKTLTQLDPATLAIEQQVTLDFGTYAMAYNETRDQYVFGLGGSYDIVITDGDFNYVKMLKGVDTGLVRQGMECDDKYIYFVQWDLKKYKNYVVVYDWEGNFINNIKVDYWVEIESIIHADGEIYLNFYDNGCTVYHATLEEV